MSHVVYSPHYNIGFFGIERLHPFDSRKYGRAWKQLSRSLGPKRLSSITTGVSRPIRHDELLAVHSESYLRQLCSSAYVARALELPILRKMP